MYVGNVTSRRDRNFEEATDYAELVGRLSLTEKVTLLTGSAVFTMAGNEKIGLAPVNLSDGPTGVRGLKFSGGRKVTLFPNATLARRRPGAPRPRTRWVGCSPRRPWPKTSGSSSARRSTCTARVLGGRLFEAYSEDPLLTGRLAAAYVQGLSRPGSAPA